MTDRKGLIKELEQHQEAKKKLTEKLSAYAAVILPGIDNTYNLSTTIAPMATKSIPLSAQVAMPGVSLLLNAISIIPSSIQSIYDTWNSKDPKYTVFDKIADIAFNLFMISLTFTTGIIGLFVVIKLGGMLLALSAAGLGLAGAAIGMGVLAYETFKVYLAKKALGTSFEGQITNRRGVYSFLKAWLWDKTVNGNALEERQNFEALCNDIYKGDKTELTEDEKTKYGDKLAIRKIELEQKYKKNSGNQSIWNKLHAISSLLGKANFSAPEKECFSFKLDSTDAITFDALKLRTMEKNAVILKDNELYYVDSLQESVTKIEPGKQFEVYNQLVENLKSNMPDIPKMVVDVEVLTGRTLHKEPLRYAYAERDRFVLELGQQLQERDALNSKNASVILIRFNGDINTLDIPQDKDAIILQDPQTFYYANHTTKKLIQIKAPAIKIEVADPTLVQTVKQQLQKIESSEDVAYTDTYYGLKNQFSDVKDTKELSDKETIASIDILRKYTICENIQEALSNIKQVESTIEGITQPLAPLVKKDQEANQMLKAMGINSALALTGLIIAGIGFSAMFFAAPPALPIALGIIGVTLAAVGLVKFGVEQYLAWKKGQAIKSELDKESVELIYEADSMIAMTKQLNDVNHARVHQQTPAEKAEMSPEDMLKKANAPARPEIVDDYKYDPTIQVKPGFKERFGALIEEYDGQNEPKDAHNIVPK